MSGSSPAGTSDVGTTVREMWATRPARRDDERKVAGVAGAIARRYAVDPTLVRVALVVLALSGGGVLLYLAAWAALPADPTDPPRGRGRRDERGRSAPPPFVLVLAVVAAVLTLGPVAGGRLGAVVGLALAAVALYGLHTGRAALGVPGVPGTARVVPGATRVDTPAAGPAGPAAADATEPVDAPTTHAPDPVAPPAWDPLGAAPFAWDLPEPPEGTAGTTGPATRRSSRVTLVTLALALVAAGTAGGLALAGVPWVTTTVVWASALAVVGLGLVVGAFRHEGRGLIVAAVPLVALTVVSASGVLGTVGGPSGPDARGFGDVDVAPTSAALVQPVYRTGFGDVDLDLRAVTATPGGPVRTSVQTGAGDATVRVPVDATVTVTCGSGVGDVDCLGRRDGATGVLDPGSGRPGAPAFDVTVRSGAGDVAVQRG